MTHGFVVISAIQRWNVWNLKLCIEFKVYPIQGLSSCNMQCKSSSPCSAWINSDIEKLSQPFLADKSSGKNLNKHKSISMFVSVRTSSTKHKRIFFAFYLLLPCWQLSYLTTIVEKWVYCKLNYVDHHLFNIKTFLGVDGLMSLLTAVWTNWTRVKNAEQALHQHHHHLCHHHHHHFHRCHHHHHCSHHHHHPQAKAGLWPARPSGIVGPRYNSSENLLGCSQRLTSRL